MLKNELYLIRKFHLVLEIGLFLFLYVVSCVHYSMKSQGTMQVSFGNDSSHINNMEYLEAVYTDSVDLVYDSTTDIHHVRLKHGRKYFFAFYSEDPSSLHRIVPSERSTVYYLFAMLDSISLQDTIFLNPRSTKILSYRYEIPNNFIETGLQFQGALIIFRKVSDSLMGEITFSGKVYDISPRRISVNRKYRLVNGKISFKAVKKSVENISPYLNDVWLPKELLVEFIEE